jgi:hypothetical protein
LVDADAFARFADPYTVGVGAVGELGAVGALGALFGAEEMLGELARKLWCRRADDEIGLRGILSEPLGKVHSFFSLSQ